MPSPGAAKRMASQIAGEHMANYGPYEDLLKFLYNQMLSSPVASLVFGGGMSPTAVAQMQGRVESDAFGAMPSFGGLSLYDITLGTSQLDDKDPLLLRLGFNFGSGGANQSGTWG